MANITGGHCARDVRDFSFSAIEIRTGNEATSHSSRERIAFKSNSAALLFTKYKKKKKTVIGATHSLA